MMVGVRFKFPVGTERHDRRIEPREVRLRQLYLLTALPYDRCEREPACRPQKLSERPLAPRNTRGVAHREWT